MLETLYSTGVRRSEIANIRVCDINLDQGILFIREGKGCKDRYIPIGERATQWIEKYIYEIRYIYVNSPDCGTLFLTKSGSKFSPDLMGDHIKTLIKRSGVEKKGGCHIFRHTFATLLLDSGADIRSIQKMLGHESLETTQIYTRVSVQKLKKVHDLYHPAKAERS